MLLPSLEFPEKRPLQSEKDVRRRERWQTIERTSIPQPRELAVLIEITGIPAIYPVVVEKTSGSRYTSHFNFPAETGSAGIPCVSRGINPACDQANSVIKARLER
ncbi:MAG: hypothetical protein DWI29_01860 [Planctomycetota bacterium]|nr:MAG: hypothetical protein DWI29_01860 [Planctomycetota bacterium]